MAMNGKRDKSGANDEVPVRTSFGQIQEQSNGAKDDPDYLR